MNTGGTTSAGKWSKTRYNHYHPKQQSWSKVMENYLKACDYERVFILMLCHEHWLGCWFEHYSGSWGKRKEGGGGLRVRLPSLLSLFNESCQYS